jgi:hypothetical protein
MKKNTIFKAVIGVLLASISIIAGIWIVKHLITHPSSTSYYKLKNQQKFTNIDQNWYYYCEDLI